MNRRPVQAALPITLAELAHIQPLAAARAQLADPARGVERVILAQTFDRLRCSTPHALIVLNAETATGGWSLAAALHLAWERNASAVVVSAAVANQSGAALAERLNISLLVIDTDPVDTALQLAGLVSAPHAARALRQARCAERLAEESSLRGVLGVLNSELNGVAVALRAGTAVLAGRSAAASPRGDATEISVPVHGPGELHGSGEQAAARLVAVVPAAQAAAVPQVEALLRLARPALVAAWAQIRLNSSVRAAREQAAFGMLRRLAAEPPAGPQPGPATRPAAGRATRTAAGRPARGRPRRCPVDQRARLAG